MAYRVLDNIEEKMIKAIVKIGAKEGVSKVTAIKIAALCDISSFTVFEHFKTKRGFLDAAAEYVDRRYMKVMSQLFKQGKNQVEVFNEMVDKFVADADSCLYYNSYTNTFGFDPTPNNSREKEFLSYARAYFGNESFSELKFLMAWDYITTMGFYYAEKIIRGFITDDAETRGIIEEIVFKGFSYL